MTPTEIRGHVAVDLDDVTVDFFRGVIDSMHREFGVTIDKAQCTSWDNNPVKRFDWRAQGYKGWWDWMEKRDWLWATFGAVPGAIGGINALRERGWYVEALTSKPAWAEPQVWRWLGRWRPPFNQVTIVNGKQRKVDFSRATILVDDKPDNCMEWEDDPEWGRSAVVFDQPWNQAAKHAGRARSWAEVVEEVERLGS